MSILRKSQEQNSSQANVLANAQNGNWDGGQLVTLTVNPGSNNYTCNNIQNEATAIMLYNSAGTDHDTVITVTTANSAAPVKVTVPGTTGNQGLATIVLVNGSVTNSVTVNMTPDQPSDSQVQAVIVSLAFPINTSGISNNQLQANGQKQSFTKFSRFYSVPASNWYQLDLQSNVTQFFCTQFGLGSNSVTIYCLNPGPNPAASVVQADANNPVAYKIIVPADGQQQKISQSIFGNGQQVVWMNADSIQNSQNATIALTNLA